jgi:hypothetical protein
MRRDKREQSLEAIRSDPTVKVILISFKAGSTGLNLTSCNNVILLDLWWSVSHKRASQEHDWNKVYHRNPALEDQAYDRAHRLGQKLDCFIYKLTVERSVEDRILTVSQLPARWESEVDVHFMHAQLQGAKRELAKAALSGDSTKNLKLNLQDLMGNPLNRSLSQWGLFTDNPFTIALFRAPPAGSPDDDD